MANLKAILIVFVFAWASVGCAPSSSTNLVRIEAIERYCHSVSGSDLSLWQCRRFYENSNSEIPAPSMKPASPRIATTASPGLDYCSTVPGGQFGQWQCRQFYERHTRSGDSIPIVPHRGVPPRLPNKFRSDSGNLYATTVGQSDAIVFDGTIRPNDHLAFITLANKLDRPLVFLGGGGGSVTASIQIGRFIRSRQLATIVENANYCASACALIWMAGSKRYMGPTSIIGFHAAYRLNAGVPSESGVGNALVGAYLNRLGLSDRFIIFATQAAPDELQFVNIISARTLGLEVAETPAWMVPSR